MALFSCRRHALALALSLAYSASAYATQYLFGVSVSPGQSLALRKGDTIAVSGMATGSAVSVRERGSLDARDITIVNSTHGNAVGYAYGLIGLDGSDSMLQASQITMAGRRARGVQLQGAARAMLQLSDITLAGAQSAGAVAREGAVLSFNRARLHVTGADSTGIMADGSDAVVVGMVDVDHRGPTTTPGAAHGALVRDGGMAGLGNSLLVTRAAGVSAVTIEGATSRFTASHSRLVAEGAGAAALAGGGGAILLDATEVNGPIAIRTAAAGGGQLDVDAMGGSRLVGAVRSQSVALALRLTDSFMEADTSRAGAGALDMHMTGSQWSGRALSGGNVRMDGSTWSLTGNSRLDQLSLTGGSRVGFVDTMPDFGVLRLGTLQAADASSVIRLRTQLGTGGAPGAQHTDRLLVDNDVNGTTVLDIVPTNDAGGATAAGAEGGITVAQVGGTAGALSFQLARGYVVAGPWRYQLNAYAPGQTSARQRLVNGEGDTFWDYRLQTAQVDEAGAVHPSSGATDAQGELPAPALAEGAAPERPLPLLPTRNALAPQVPAYLVLPGALFSAGRESMERTVADGSPSGAASDASRPTVRAAVTGSQSTYRSSLPFQRYGMAYARHDRGLQVAADLVAFESDNTRMRSGIVATTTRMTVAPRAADGASRATTHAQGVALAYAVDIHHAWRINWAYGFTRHRMAVDTPGRGQALSSLRANATSASLAASYLWQVAPRVRIEPGASFLWQRLRFNRVTDRDGVTVRMGAPERSTLRVGARATLALRGGSDATAAGLLLHVDGRYVTTHDAGGSVQLSGTRFHTGRGGRAIELASGVTMPWRHGLSFTGEVLTRSRLGGAGEAGRSARLGMVMAL